MTIAMQADEPPLRLAAVLSEKFTDTVTLSKIAAEDEDGEVRKAASDRVQKLGQSPR